MVQRVPPTQPEGHSPGWAPARREDVFILIAAFREASVIGGVVRELRGRYPNVVVVDDGSNDATADEARAAGALVLSHVVNRGQGAALQTAITYGLQQGARYLITFDADGQHRPEDIAGLLEPIERGEADIVLGSRFLGSTEGMPRRRGLLLQLGVLFTRGMSGARLTDTHNGLRAFSRRAAARIQLTEDRMAHASELIDQVVRMHLPYIEVPVTIRYTEYSRNKGQKMSASFRILLDDLSRRILGPA
jgi:glycosyltransferase involved in cell wall biosynthesis